MPKASGFAIDLQPLQDFIVKMRATQPRLYRILRQDLIEAGATVAARAKELATEHSTSIPPTIGVRMMGGAGATEVRVFAGNDDTPLAGLYEVGNKSGGGGATFRHPVYGDTSNWVNQPRYPYLKPALRDTEDLVVERVGLAVALAMEAAVRESTEG